MSAVHEQAYRPIKYIQSQCQCEFVERFNVPSAGIAKVHTVSEHLKLEQNRYLTV